jgi:hypothetical protein
MSVFRKYPGLVVTLVLVASCSQATVKDFDSWCSYVHDPKQGEYDVLTFDRDAVRGAVVKRWDGIIEQNAREVLASPGRDGKPDSLIIELRRLKMLGVWSVGDTIHLGVVLFPPPTLSPGESTAHALALAYRQRMDAVRAPDAKATTEAGMYCLYTGLNTFFARVDVHAADGTEAIPNELFERLKRYQ